MKIGLNYLRVDPAVAGGIHSYTLGLLEAFANVGNGHRFRLYAAPANQHLFEPFRHCRNFEVIVVGDPLLGLKKHVSRIALLSHSSEFYKLTSNLLFRNVRKLMDAEVDIIYTPTTVLQWFDSCKPTVITMHDIQQVHYPQFFSWSVRLSRRITYGLTARHASYFQAISEFTKRDFLGYFRELSEEIIEVIPSGVNIARFTGPKTTEDVCTRYGLPGRFLFFPANLWPHKNHMTVLKALKQIENDHGLKIPLVLTGGRFPATPKEIFQFIADDRMTYVLYLGTVPDQEMVALFQRAAFMITATLYEATSLPVLEAAAAGTPIIASRIPPLEELAQELQLNLFNPLDVDELAQLIFALWNDQSTASAQAAINRKQIALFSWENTARKYLQFFERIVKSEPGFQQDEDPQRFESPRVRCQSHAG